MSVPKPTISTSHRLTSHIKLWGRNHPVFLVIHFTAGLYDTPKGQASTYQSYVDRGSNAHYLVGSDGIWEMVDPELYYCTYSCGSPVGRKNICRVPGWGPDGGYAGPLSASHAGIAGHTNTINIEICSYKMGRKRCDPTDSGWCFKDSTYAAAVELAAWICDRFSIKNENIIMHNQVTGKLCPAMWCNREGAEAGFQQFKLDVAYKMNEMDVPIENVDAPPDVTGTVAVQPGTYFFARPSERSVKVGQAPSAMSVPYDFEDNGFYYTDQGWVQP